MMKPARRQTVFERMKNRWAYLGTKAAAHALAVTGSITFFVSAAICIVFLLLSADKWMNMQWNAAAIAAAAVSAAGAVLWRSSSIKVQTIEYVPPVREQIAHLPAEDVLVRGSDEPATTHDELLRAAITITPAEEKNLLRPHEIVTAESPQKIGGHPL